MLRCRRAIDRPERHDVHDGVRQPAVVINTPVTGNYTVDAGNSLELSDMDDTNTIFFYSGSTYRIKGVRFAGGDQTAPGIFSQG